MVEVKMPAWLVLPAVMLVGCGPRQDAAYDQTAVEPPEARVLLSDLGCAPCHDGITVETDIRQKAPDLTHAGLRFNPDHVFSYLQYPTRIRQHIGFSRMPDFRLDERERLALALYLEQQVPDGIEPPPFVLQEAYATAKAAHPEITPETGMRVFLSSSCISCHDQSSILPWEKKNAPDLSMEGTRVTEEWLAAYLRNPTPIRPYGFFPGSGSRHPDFKLAVGEVRVLTDYLMGRQELSDPEPTMFEPEVLMPFFMAKARGLLREKLPCLGCHRLGGEGGRIGPDLSSLGTRLQPEFVYRMVRDPQSVMPNTIMPKILMPPGNLKLIVNYLLQQDLPREPVPILSRVDNPPVFHQELEGGERLYGQYCAPCHGVDGQGDGYNSGNLATAPTKHADAAYMSGRPDDVLFDGIFAGGYILGRSNQMPAWGFTLDRDDIWQLVRYIRELCQCQGPAWSRDNR